MTFEQHQRPAEKVTSSAPRRAVEGFAADTSLDFEREMYWGVLEEASLAEIARGVTDHLGDGRTVVHGPWDPAACSARLVEWFDRGLIELYDAREGYPTNRSDIPGPPDTRHGPTGVVPAGRTRELLADWQHWGDADDLWPSLRLVVTDRGMQELEEPAAQTP